MNVIRAAFRFLNSHAVKVLLVGLAGVAWHNWRLWQKDKALLADKAHAEPLPALESWPGLPKVSVLVAAWNEAPNIKLHIQSFLGLRYPNRELILCAGGCDGTYDLASKANASTVKVLKQYPGEGKQRALSHCLLEATGKIVFLTDADCSLDDHSFERTIYAVAVGDEQVCTGTSRPSDHQLANAFVATQAARQIYAAYRFPDYVSGLLGRNCAIERGLLERSRGLEAPAPTGTDYVLAKMLARAGAKIRQLPHSQVTTIYPTRAGAYVRQQRRWLRTAFVQGQRFGSTTEVRTSAQASLTGVTMLLLPSAGLIGGPIVFVLWLVALTQAIVSRLRCLWFAARILHHPIDARQLVGQPLFLFLDFWAWSSRILDPLLLDRNNQW